MKQISIKVPEWIDEDLVKLQMERIVSLETRKRELTEEILKKMNVGDEELEYLERIREDVWKEEKKRLSLK
jgi:hypothetical protein